MEQRSRPTDLDHMQRQVATLFEEDRIGRLVCCRVPSPRMRPAPRFFLGRTRHGHLWRFRADLEDAKVRALARLAGREAPIAAAVSEPGPPERAEPMRRVLEPIVHEWRGPAFRFPEGPQALQVEPGVSRLGLPDAVRLGASFPGLADELREASPIAAWVEDDRVVCVCYAARTGPSSACGRGVEAGVETAAGWRGRGLATRVVRSWACWVRSRGDVPLYSTSWQNRAALALARRLGLVPYGEDWHLT